MSLSITMFVMHPSGQSVAEVKLWEYYLVEMSRFSVGPRTLGPATGTSSLFTVASQHVLISAAGGAVMMGIGWVIRRVRRRK